MIPAIHSENQNFKSQGVTEVLREVHIYGAHFCVCGFFRVKLVQAACHPISLAQKFKSRPIDVLVRTTGILAWDRTSDCNAHLGKPVSLLWQPATLALCKNSWACGQNSC